MIKFCNKHSQSYEKNILNNYKKSLLFQSTKIISQFKSQTHTPCPSHRPVYDGRRATGPFVVVTSPNSQPGESGTSLGPT